MNEPQNDQPSTAVLAEDAVRSYVLLSLRTGRQGSQVDSPIHLSRLLAAYGNPTLHSTDRTQSRQKQEVVIT